MQQLFTSWENSLLTKTIERIHIQKIYHTLEIKKTHCTGYLNVTLYSNNLHILNFIYNRIAINMNIAFITLDKSDYGC